MKVLVFGSSSTVYFNLTEELKSLNESFRKVQIKVVTVSGATISGFGKRDSTMNSMGVLIDAIKDFEPDHICFALGQTDIELGIYYKMVVKGEIINFNDYAIALSEQYINLIFDFQKKLSLPDSAIIIKGVNIPVLTKQRLKAIQYTSRIITENIKKEERPQYIKKLKELYPSGLERYMLHMNFNKLIKDKIKDKYGYFDINDLVEDPDKLGHCKTIFIPSKPDHHLIDTLFIRENFINRLIISAIKRN